MASEANRARFHDLRRLETVDSTNRYLLDRARSGAPEGEVVVADGQTAGRGRRGRTWEAPPGAALLMSVLARPQRTVLPPARRWLLTAAMALAAADACRSAAPDVGPIDIKWPNDLLLSGRKLAGILAEADAGAIVVGIGVNLTWCPPGAALLGAVERDQLLDGVLDRLDGWWDHWSEVEAAYRHRCVTVGRWVHVTLADGEVVGRAVGIAPDGALELDTPEGPERFLVGDVVHVTDP